MKDLSNARASFRSIFKDTMTPSFVENTVQEGTIVKPLLHQNVTLATKKLGLFNMNPNNSSGIFFLI